MKIYLAARFSRRHECHALGKRLERLGHTITSRWTLPNTDHVLPVGPSERAGDSERARFALEDLEDVDQADAVISLMEPEARNNTRGGRHVEFGYALAKGKRMLIVGCRETVFHHLPWVEHFEDVDALVRALESES